MKHITRILLSIFLLTSFGAMAQDSQSVEMADPMFQSGKIYVVITVLSIIFIGILVYLIMLDRKIGKLEKELKNKE